MLEVEKRFTLGAGGYVLEEVFGWGGGKFVEKKTFLRARNLVG